jgi:hypothetical protein
MANFKTIDPGAIASLNARAIELVDDDNNEVDAIKAVARRDDMVPVADNGQCIVYRTPDGLHVNAWVDAPDGGIKDGGLGFDDQVEWAE